MAGLPASRAILCPIDFSDGSRAALSYAAAIADRRRVPLTVLAVDDPLLASAAVAAHLGTLSLETERQLRRFVSDTVAGAPNAADIAFRVATGKPAPEILRIARELDSALIVMSSHGRSGVSKQFFGSTTERVLRETTVPVLVVPASRPLDGTNTVAHLHLVLAPVDLGPFSRRQVEIATAVANSLALPLTLVHVLEPIFFAPHIREVMDAVDGARHGAAETRLKELVAAAGGGAPETAILTGDPASKISQLAADRRAGLIVMGLHGSEPFGPRMGSVTYRVLRLTHSLVLALPPDPDAPVG